MLNRTKKYHIDMLGRLLKRNDKESSEKLQDIKNVALANQNIFEVLMEASKVCSLGQIKNVLFEVGGQYRRNM